MKQKRGTLLHLEVLDFFSFFENQLISMWRLVNEFQYDMRWKLYLNVSSKAAVSLLDIRKLVAQYVNVSCPCDLHSFKEKKTTSISLCTCFKVIVNLNSSTLRNCPLFLLESFYCCCDNFSSSFSFGQV